MIAVESNVGVGRMGYDGNNPGSDQQQQSAVMVTNSPLSVDPILPTGPCFNVIQGIANDCELELL